MADNSESFFVKIGVLFDKSGAKTATVAMLDIKQTAEGIYDSFKKIVDVNSDLYRSAQYLNVGTDELQVWQRVFKLMGGSADDARASIANLNFVYDKLRLGLDQEKATIGARLGLTPEDYLTFDTMLKGLNRSYNELFKGDRGAFTPLAQQLGLNQSAILLVTQSVKDYENTLKRAGSLPIINQADLARIEKVRQSMEMLSSTFETFWSRIVANNSKELEKLFKGLEEIVSNPDNIKAMNELFKAIADGFRALATDENIKFVIEALGNISKVVLQGAGETIKGVRMTTEALTSSDTASAFGMDTNLGKAIKYTYMLNPITGGPALAKEASNLATTIYNYFTISNPNPEKVAEIVVEKQQQNGRAVANAQNAISY